MGLVSDPNSEAVHISIGMSGFKLEISLQVDGPWRKDPEFDPEYI